MFRTKSILFVAVLIFAAYSSIVGRVGFKTIRKDWTEVIGKTLDAAKELIHHDLPDIDFYVVNEEMYNHIPEEGYFNKVILGTNSDSVVVKKAKYFGYVPDLDFVNEFVRKPYLEAVEAIKTHLPSLKVVVVHGAETVYTCCAETRFVDHLELKVDDGHLLLSVTYKY